mgnify:CR=1 FL=1
MKIKAAVVEKKGDPFVIKMTQPMFKYIWWPAVFATQTKLFVKGMQA